jgi:hypothetical protein
MSAVSKANVEALEKRNFIKGQTIQGAQTALKQAQV